MDAPRTAAPVGRLTGSRSPRRPDWVVLDLGGVLLVRARTALLGEAADACGVAPADLDGAFGMLRRALWRGDLGAREAWEALAAAAGAPGTPCPWREDAPPARLLRLGAAGRVPGWAGRASIAVLSNQRAGWVRPLLEEAGLPPHLAHVWISSETRRVKPDPEAFAPLAELGAPGAVLYVDDQARNLRAAEAVGARVLHADPEGRWVAALDRILA